MRKIIALLLFSIIMGVISNQLPIGNVLFKAQRKGNGASMSNIEQNLAKIKTAIYGEEVRDAIHDSILQCYEDNVAGHDAKTEVVDARTDVNGKLYGSLKARLDTENNDLKSALNQNHINYVPLHKNKGYALNGSSVDLSKPTNINGVNSGYKECNAGDVVTLNSTGYVAYRAYAFVDDSGSILEVSASGISFVNEEKIAPANTRYLVVNTTEEIYSYIGKALYSQIDTLNAVTDEEHDYIINNLPATAFREAGENHIGCNMSASGEVQPVSGNVSQITVFPITKGEAITIIGNNVKLSGNLCLVGFSTEDFAISNQCEVIIMGSATATNYNEKYISKENGYLYCAWRYENDSGRISIKRNPLKSAITLLNYGPTDESELSGVKIEHAYFNLYNNNRIDIATGTYAGNHEITMYQVTAGENYYIRGKNASSGSALRALIAFSEDSYLLNHNADMTNMIVQGLEAETAANYDISFAPKVSGYVYIYKNISFDTCKIYQAIFDNREILKLTNSSYKELKIQCFGDSITDNTWGDKVTWTNFFDEYLTQRPVKLINSGNGGSHVGHGHSTGGQYTNLEYNYVYDLITNPNVFQNDCDIYTILIGANDYNSGELGEWGDTTIDTFYGAVRMICEYMSTNVEGMLLFITPIQRYNSADTDRPKNADGEPINEYGATVRDYAEAIVKTCHFYSIPVLDLNYDSGINRINIDKYTADGLHPNEKGDKRIAKLIASEIKKYLGI